MDIKLNTFLTLCKTLNYRQAADLLHLTQPAVTKQIQSLEQQYGVKLFKYDGKKILKTAECEVLETYAYHIKHEYGEMEKALANTDHVHLRIGATKTIGDYVIGDYMYKYLEEEQHHLSLIVDNTEHLLRMLDESLLDFALIEGMFYKNKYAHQLYKKEAFIGICSINHPFAGKNISVDELLLETIIVREEGSGTRDILENELRNQGYQLEDFKKVTQISSFRHIKGLVKKNMGVSLVYQSVISEKHDTLGVFYVNEFEKIHEFNIVYLKNANVKDSIALFFGKL